MRRAIGSAMGPATAALRWPGSSTVCWRPTRPTVTRTNSASGRNSSTPRRPRRQSRSWPSSSTTIRCCLERMAGGKRLARAEDLGVADLAFRKAIGAYIPPDAAIPPPHRSKYPIQGVWADSRAFFNPPEAHSFLKATDQFRDEFMRLYRPMAGTPIWLIGYSMGGMSVFKCLTALPPEWRQFVVGVSTMGDPCMPPEGSLTGNDPGDGITKQYQPEWVRDRYWSYGIDGDWYPRCENPLLFALGEVVVRMELTLEFVQFLLGWLLTLPGRILTGQAPTNDPLGGILALLAR